MLSSANVDWKIAIRITKLMRYSQSLKTPFETWEITTSLRWRFFFKISFNNSLKSFDFWGDGRSKSPPIVVLCKAVGKSHFALFDKRLAITCHSISATCHSLATFQQVRMKENGSRDLINLVIADRLDKHCCSPCHGDIETFTIRLYVNRGHPHCTPQIFPNPPPMSRIRACIGLTRKCLHVCQYKCGCQSCKVSPSHKWQPHNLKCSHVLSCLLK